MAGAVPGQTPQEGKAQGERDRARYVVEDDGTTPPDLFGLAQPAPT